MVLPQFEDSPAKALLVEVKLPAIGAEPAQTLRYQNYYPEGMIQWSGDNQLYQYLPMGFSGIPRSMEMDNTPTRVVIPNNPVIYELRRQYDGFRKAIVITREIWPENPAGVPIVNRLQIAESTLDGATINLELRSPISAIGGTFGRYFTTKDFPYLPTRITTALG